MPFSLLVLCQIRTGANDVCDTFNIFVAKPAMCSFAGLVNAILHRISSNSLLLCRAKLNFTLFSSPFLNHSLLLLSLWYSVSLTNCPWRVFSSTLSISFLSCSHWLCIFPSCVQLLQSRLGPPYSVMHTLIDFIFPPRHSPRHLPDLFLDHSESVASV